MAPQECRGVHVPVARGGERHLLPLCSSGLQEAARGGGDDNPEPGVRLPRALGRGAAGGAGDEGRRHEGGLSPVHGLSGDGVGPDHDPVCGHHHRHLRRPPIPGEGGVVNIMGDTRSEGGVAEQVRTSDTWQIL